MIAHILLKSNSKDRIYRLVFTKTIKCKSKNFRIASIASFIKTTNLLTIRFSLMCTKFSFLLLLNGLLRKSLTKTTLPLSKRFSKESKMVKAMQMILSRNSRRSLTLKNKICSSLPLGERAKIFLYLLIIKTKRFKLVILY